jgi:hypothetical protein
MNVVWKANQDSWCSKGWEEQTIDSATALIAETCCLSNGMRTKASNSNGMQLLDKHSRKLGRLQRSASTGIIASFLNRILATDHALSAPTVGPPICLCFKKSQIRQSCGQTTVFSRSVMLFTNKITKQETHSPDPSSSIKLPIVPTYQQPLSQHHVLGPLPHAMHLPEARLLD